MRLSRKDRAPISHIERGREGEREEGREGSVALYMYVYPYTVYSIWYVCLCAQQVSLLLSLSFYLSSFLALD